MLYLGSEYAYPERPTAKSGLVKDQSVNKVGETSIDTEFL